jgi:hypothetical protein
MLTTTSCNTLKDMIDDALQRVDPEMMMESEDKIKVWGYLMTLYNLKPGLRKFGKRGATAAMKEVMQLHVMDTWTAMDLAKLSREQQKRALSSVLFLNKKQTGARKGQACINEVPQQAYISKEDAALPTVLTESMFITAAIAANKTRKVQFLMC